MQCFLKGDSTTCLVKINYSVGDNSVYKMEIQQYMGVD